MSSRKVQARKLANRLNSEIAKSRTWRQIAKDFPPVVKAGTLNRIAKTNGVWLPKKQAILDALFPCPEKPAKILPEWMQQWVDGKELKKIRKHISAMAKQTRQDLGLQKR